MPVMTTLGLSSTIIRVLIGSCLCAAVMPSATKRTRYAFLGGVVLLVIVRFITDLDSVPVNKGFAIALMGCIGLIAAAKSLEFAVQTKTVTTEVIYAALSTYLLAGIFFGELYFAIESLWQGSIVGPDPVTESRAVYYSFVTLATLGYGDYLPRTDIARGIAVFEVVGGQLFLAVMVARLIGLFAPKKEIS